MKYLRLLIALLILLSGCAGIQYQDQSLSPKLPDGVNSTALGITSGQTISVTRK